MQQSQEQQKVISLTNNFMKQLQKTAGNELVQSNRTVSSNATQPSFGIAGNDSVQLCAQSPNQAANLYFVGVGPAAVQGQQPAHLVDQPPRFGGPLATPLPVSLSSSPLHLAQTHPSQ